MDMRKIPIPAGLVLSLILPFMGGTIESRAQSNDFFSNTQLSGRLSSSAAGCPATATCTANGPGFNPTGLVNHADPNAVITGAPKIDGGSPPFFSQLGPGAITDNLFGIISQVHPGPDGIPNTADDHPIVCGRPHGDPTTGAGVPPFSVGANGSSLNCGDLRFDPESQGQIIPTIPISNTISLSPIFTFQADLNPSAEAHLGLHLTGSFTSTPSSRNTQGGQQLFQVTGLTAGGTSATVGSTGTLTNPGGGDQTLLFNTEWSITGSFDGPTNRPRLSWSMALDNPSASTPRTSPFSDNQIDSTNTLGTLSASGAFLYNDGAFQQAIIPSPCWWSSCTLPLP